MLQAIDWRITHSCNNYCFYCYGNKPINRVSISEEEILLKKIISSPVKMVNITGGEPMLEPERCFNIIKTLTAGGKSVYFSTNATNLEDNLDFIFENVDLLGLPLDGYDELSNQINGRAQNSFALVKNVLEKNNCRNEKINIKIGTVITKKNLDLKHLSKMCDLLTEQGIKVWRLYEMIPVNRGANNRDKLELNDLDRVELYNIICKLRELAPNIKIEFASRASRASAYFIIQPDGSVIVPIDSIDNTQEKIVGNLLTESFDEVYNKWKSVSGMENDTEYMQMRTADVVSKMSITFD